MSNLVDRQAAIDALHEWEEVYTWDENCLEDREKFYAPSEVIEDLPAAKLERDIPMKPKETTDRTWGIKSRQAVCPKCDNYLSNVVFIGDGKHVTYCEHCGQAIDWEGWDAECSE